MGVYSEMDLDMQYGSDSPFAEDNLFSDEERTVETGAVQQSSILPMKSATDSAAQPQPVKKAEQDSPAPTETADATEEDEDAKRKAHEESEAKRKAEWEAKQQAKKVAEQEQLDRLAAMSDDEVKSEADAVIPKNNELVMVKSVTSKEKSEKAPALYDLTTLQRDANRQLGYTAQQTLDYVQSLYEKKLCTYPRTDSRYLTDDMEGGVNALVLCSSGICEEACPATVLSRQICDSKKVSDHHAIIPTMAAGETDINALPAGEREIIKLIAKQVLRAVSESYRFHETVAVISCGNHTFTAKGKIIENIGWKICSENEQTDKVLPELADGDELKIAGSAIKEGTTKPPAHFTEDSLLSAMEVAGAKEMPDDAERKGLGTPATRAGIIEKLIATGFVERKKARKSVSLVPANTGVSLITVLPEQLQSPLLTAEWENKLKMVERGELDADAFMREISLMVNELVKNYSVIKGAEVLFPSGRDVVGKCPRCGGDVTESKKGFFCERNDCRFGLWRDNKFLTGKKITLTKKMAAALLKDGRIPIKGIFSENTGKSYDATLVMTDDGAKTIYSLDFGKE